jgi:hypothetical protein
MRLSQELTMLMILALGALGCTGCFGLRNHALLQHACEECKKGPFCGFETLEPKYCVLCQKPLDGRADMTVDARYAELEELADALERECKGIFNRHATADDDRAAAQRMFEQCGAIRRWTAKERGLSTYQ